MGNIDKDECQVKGCKNKSGFLYITHEDEDKYMCKGCKDKYIGRNLGEVEEMMRSVISDDQ